MLTPSSSSEQAVAFVLPRALLSQLLVRVRPLVPWSMVDPFSWKQQWKLLKTSAISAEYLQHNRFTPAICTGLGWCPLPTWASHKSQAISQQACGQRASASPIADSRRKSGAGKQQASIQIHTASTCTCCFAQHCLAPAKWKRWLCIRLLSWQHNHSYK